LGNGEPSTPSQIAEKQRKQKKEYYWIIPMYSKPNIIVD